MNLNKYDASWHTTKYSAFNYPSCISDMELTESESKGII